MAPENTTACATALLEKISSIDEQMRKTCDLIPISIWGFDPETQEMLRLRKHKIVDQKLTDKEKQALSNAEKQHIARTAGAVCRRVSEVFELLAAKIDKSFRPNMVCPTTTPLENENGEHSEKERGKSFVKSSNVTDSSSKSFEKEIGRLRSLQPRASVTSRKSLTSTASNGEKLDTPTTNGNCVTKEFENLSTGEAKKRYGGTSSDMKEKKQKNEVPCEAKDENPDILAQREFALRKLQEKLKAMKAHREGRKKANNDSTAISNYEERRKLKRRISKMKMKQRRAKSKQQDSGRSSDSITKSEMEQSKDDTVSFSKFDFIIKDDKRKKRLTTSEKKHKFSGKDYKSLLKKVEKREEKLERLREKEPEKAIDMENNIRWKRAFNKAQGIKVKDNVHFLQKGLKRKEKLKEKRKEKWSKREANVVRGKEKKQNKRKENICKRVEEKKKRKMKLLRKKGRIL